MTILELGALGEFAGALLLFLSVIYVGVQVRQNTNATKAQMYQARLDSIQQALLVAAESDELSSIITTMVQDGRADPARLADLTPLEHTRYRQYQTANKLRCDNLYYQHEMGFIDDEFHRDVTESIIRSQGPLWRKLAIPFARRSFQEQIDVIVDAELEAQSATSSAGT